MTLGMDVWMVVVHVRIELDSETASLWIAVDECASEGSATLMKIGSANEN